MLESSPDERQQQANSRAVAQSSAESRAEAPAQVHFQLSTAKYLAAPQAQRGVGRGGGVVDCPSGNWVSSQ